MGLADDIRKSLPSRHWGNPEWKEVDEVLAADGLVLVPTDLLADIHAAFKNLGVCTDPECMKPACGWISPALVRRLRAALPEETTDHV